MKIKVLKMVPNGEHSVNVDAEIYRNDGTLLTSFYDRGFVSTKETKLEAKADFKSAVRNIRDQFVTENKAKLREAIVEIIGQEVDLDS